MRRPAARHQHHRIFKVLLFFFLMVVVVAENTYAIVQGKNGNVLLESTFGKKGETRDPCRL